MLPTHAVAVVVSILFLYLGTHACPSNKLVLESVHEVALITNDDGLLSQTWIALPICRRPMQLRGSYAVACPTSRKLGSTFSNTHDI
jgi:hypothetical protein